MVIMYENYLAHYGVKGMRWGVRKKSYPGQVRRAERKAIKKEYKRGKKAGEHGFLLKSSRHSTGKEYNRVKEDLIKSINKDSKYKTASKQAALAEKKRLDYAKNFLKKNKATLDNADAVYDKLMSDKTYLNLDKQSQKATYKKDNRVAEIEKSYINKVKDAKIKDLGISKETTKAKRLLDGHIKTYYWDHKLEYNPDNL